MMRGVGLVMAVAMAGCGDSGDSPPDAPALDVMAAMQAHGPWIEDYLWDADAYKPCTNCEHITVLEFQTDRYQLHVFKRTPGMPSTAMEQCTSTMMFAQQPVTGFAASDRVALSITVGTNTCGYTVGMKTTSVWQRIQSDATGASYVAGWDGPTDVTQPFPGYGYNTPGGTAYPMRPCATAPGTLCEPACKVPTTMDCGLPEP